VTPLVGPVGLGFLPECLMRAIAYYHRRFVLVDFQIHAVRRDRIAGVLEAGIGPAAAARSVSVVVLRRHRDRAGQWKRVHI